MDHFIFHSPTSVDEAAGLLAGGARLLAGGHTLLPALKQRLAGEVPALVSLAKIPGLNAIASVDDKIVVGAMATHEEVASSDLVRSLIPALAKLAGGIGDPQVRNRGTIGGSVANHDPAADYPAAVLALGATVRTSARTISADDFFTGLLSTALAEDEIVTEIVFPTPERAAYLKFPQPASLYALTGVFVAKTGSTVRVAVTGAGNEGVFRASEFERALTAEFTPGALVGVQLDSDMMLSDLHGSSGYRAHLAGVLAARAVASA